MSETGTRREMILDTVADLVADFLCYGRKEDEDLPRGEIEAAVAAGEITPREIVARFERELGAIVEKRP